MSRVLLTPDAIEDGVITRRTAMLAGGGSVVFAVLTGRMYQLQIAEAEDYRALSENNRFNLRLLTPERGRILDRHGRVLAENRQNFGLTLVPERTQDLDATLDAIDAVYPLDASRRKAIHEDVARSPSFATIQVAQNLAWEEFAALNLRMTGVPGVIPAVGRTRHYRGDGIFAHTLGYVGKAGPDDVAVDPDPLLREPTFRIGKTGVEASTDRVLRGASGKLKVEVNALGRVVREWPDPAMQAQSGQDVHLTLDAELQDFAATKFEDDSGGLSVMDVRTGELRVLLSMPTFDSNLFVSGLTQADMDRFNADPKRPQFNKVIGGGYPPASTFKMIVMLAALESKLINPWETVYCNGRTRLGRRTFHCWKRPGHGAMDMRDALKNSCDTYFYDIIQTIGMEHVVEVGRQLGLGATFDLGIGGQTPGILPDPSWLREVRNQAWQGGDSLNASIGQGFVLATPLQLCVMAARLANSIVKVEPSLIIGRETAEPAEIDIAPKNLAFVRDAMFGVTSEPGGTAYRADPFGLGIPMAGKTGTGQVRGITLAERRAGLRKNGVLPWHLRDHSIFVGYAPYENPRFAAGIVVEHGGSGSKRAASIVRDVLGEALRRDGVTPTSQDQDAL